MGFPRRVQKRILERCAEGIPVVVIPKNKQPARVYDIETYYKRVERTKEIRPWTFRKKREELDPLGAIEGKVLTTLRREEIYE
jgi:hypothetical protein